MSRTTFTPRGSIILPNIDDDGDGDNDLDGETISIPVTFTPVEGSDPGCTSQLTLNANTIEDGVVLFGNDGNQLVDRPLGQSSRCRYDISFPSSISVAGRTFHLNQVPGTVDTETTNRVFAIYREPLPVTMFFPMVGITVPNFDGDGDGDNDFSGTVLRVTFSPVEGSQAGCSNRQTRDFSVRFNGLVVPDIFRLLVDQPLGFGFGCLYDVEFPDTVSTAAGILKLVSVESATVSNSTFPTTTAAARYADSSVLFSPEVAIGVPAIDDDSDGDNDFAGTTFTVTFTSVRGSDGGCLSSGSESWEVGADGIVRRLGAAALLVSSPLGADSICVYDVGFPTTAAGRGLTLTFPARPLTITVESAAAVAGYDSSSGTSFPLATFEPVITGEVPTIDLDNDGNNDFTDTPVTVTFSPVAGSDSGCTSEVSINYSVSSAGQLVAATATDDDDDTDPAFTLVDRPEGVRVRCYYDVRFLPTLASGVLLLDSVAPVTINGASNAASANYSFVAMFVPDVSLSLRGTATNPKTSFVGTEFLVVFFAVQGSDAGCTATAREVWRVDANGDPRRQDPRAALVGLPEGGGSACEYNVSFSRYVASLAYVNAPPRSIPLVPAVLQQGSSSTVNITAPSVSARYLVSLSELDFFVTSSDIEVPDVDQDDNGVHDFSGRNITVTFTRDNRPNTERCDAGREVWRIGDDGSVERQSQAAGFSSFGGARCFYNVRFPDSISTADGRQTLYLEQTSTPRRVRRDDRDTPEKENSASASYVAFRNFVPDISLSLLDFNDNADSRFLDTDVTVVFFPAQGSDAECIIVTDSASEVWRVGADGNGVRQGPGVVLVGFPEFGNRPCEYNVSFPNYVFSPDANLGVPAVLQSGSSGTVNINAPVTVRYVISRSSLSLFSVSSDIQLLDVDEDDNGVHDFSGREITVIFTRTINNCSVNNEAGREVWQIGDDGSVTRQSQAARFNNFDGGADCFYDVRFPDSISTADGNQILYLEQTSTPRRVSRDDRDTPEKENSASASYVAFRNFVPDITFSFEQNRENANVHPDFVGADVTVVYFPKEGANPGCTARVEEVWRVGDTGGGVVPDTRAVLVGLPEGGGSACEYNVSFPSYFPSRVFNDAPPRSIPLVPARLETVGTSTVSIGAPPASATYFTSSSEVPLFSVSSDIEVLDVDEDDNGVHDFSGRDITVTFSSSNCDTSREVWRIVDDGSVERQSQATQLRTFTGGAFCSYNVRFSNSISTADGSRTLYLEQTSTTRIVSRDDDDTPEKENSASASYVAFRNFVPDVSLSLRGTATNPKTRFVGTEFLVVFFAVQGSDAGCTATAREVLRVDANGNPVRQDPRAVLAGFLEGESRPCNYNVSFSLAVPAADTAVSVPAFLQAGSSSTVNINAPSVSAQYEALSSALAYFSTSSDIELPDVDEDDNGVHDFSGRDIIVTFRRSISDVRCNSGREVWRIGDDGSVTRQSQAAQLRFAGGPRCFYNVSFSNSISTADGSQTLYLEQTNRQRRVSRDEGNIASARYGSAATFLTFPVNVTVSYFDDDRNGVHDFAGTEISASARPVSGSDMGCTTGATGRWTIANDGQVRLASFSPLLDLPSGATQACSYRLTFAASVAASDGTGSLIPDSPSSTTVTVSAATSSVSISYVGSLETSLFFDLNPVSVPAIDADGDGVNDFSGTEIVATLTPVDRSNPRCTSVASYTWRVNDQGSVLGTGRPTRLVNQPAGKTSQCVYDVSSPDIISTAGGDLFLQPGPPIVVRVGFSQGRSQYMLAAATFEPNVEITVPDVADSADNNVFSGTTFTVAFTRTSGSVDGCSTVSEIWQVNSAGAVVRQNPENPAVRLVDRTTAESSRCQYNVTFTETVAFAAGSGNLRLADTRARTINADTAGAVTAAYLSTQIVFEPDLEIALPAINNFLNREIEVVFTRVEGSHDDCTDGALLTLRIEGGGQVVPIFVPTLVDLPTGAGSRCEYSTAIPESLFNGNLILTSESPVVINGGTGAAAARYVSVFSPRITITVPRVDSANDGVNDFSGTEIMVMFTPTDASPAECPAETEVWRIDDAGTTARQGSTPLRFVNVAAEQTGSCFYSTIFPESIADGNLRLTSDSPVVINTGATMAAARYATVFSPSVSIAVPQIDAADGNSIFAGTTFAVVFTRANNSHHNCTSEASETWRVDDAGTTARQGSPVGLVDRPAGQTSRCPYNVRFQQTVSTAVGDLELVSESLVEVSAASLSAEATYTNLFVPDVDITVSATDFFSGATIAVTFTSATSPPNGCTESASERWRLNNDGSLTRVGSGASLADYPPGMPDRCSYGVEFQETVPDDAGVLMLVPPSSPLLVSATSRTVAASYVSRFFPDVSITVLDIDEDGDGVNDFSGIDITIEFSPISDAPSGCTDIVEETWQVGDDGVAQRSGEATPLSDLPEGQTDRCVYDVVFPNVVDDPDTVDDGDLVLISDPRRISAGNVVADAEYSNSGSTFAPDVAITVTRLNALAGTMIRVTFTPTASANAGCTPTAEGIWLVGDNGVVELSGELPELADRLAGTSGRCRYNAEFPNPAPATLTINPTTPTIDVDLNLTSASPVEFANGDALSANYVTGQSTFEPDVDITAPTTDLFSGTTIDVSYATNSFSGCTGTDEETWVIGNGGVVERQGPAAELVAYLAGGVVRCSYTVAFQATVPAADGSGELMLDSVSAAVFAAGEPVAAGYVTKFLSDVTVTVPLVDADEDEVNDFSGTDITVTLTPTASSPAGCTPAAAEVWRVGDDVTAARQGAATQLLDRPTGAASRCQYSTVFPASAAGGDLILTSDSPVVIDGSAATAAGRYATVFSPEVTVDGASG